MSSRLGPRHGGAPYRSPIILAVVGVLLVGVLLNRTGSGSARQSAAAISPVPVAAPAQALSSSWFCAGATDNGTGNGQASAPGRVVIANSSSVPASGSVTLVPSGGANRTLPVRVGADSSTFVSEQVTGGTPWIGAVVDMDAGAVAVSQEIDSSLGWSATPCATAGSSAWYFATGFTMANAGVELSLLNPYPSDSVVDLSFTTNQGLETPEEFQGLVVPGDGMLSVNLGDHLRRRQAIATTVTARTGRVVAWKTSWVLKPQPGAVLAGTPAASSPLADPSWPVPGVTVTLGASSPGISWTWPDGMAGNGVAEQYFIYNPGPDTANVRLSIGLAQGQAEPFDLTVGPYQVEPVVSEQQARIPSGVAHSAALVSTNGVPVVAERWISAGPPSAWQGIGELLGGQMSAASWLVPDVRAGPYRHAVLVLYNPGAVPAQATVAALSKGRRLAIPGLRPVTVGPGQRVALSINAYQQGLVAPVVVTATGSIYVESDNYGQSGAPGVALSFGVPLSP
jgi:Family of unknown function (DUF5719)